MGWIGFVRKIKMNRKVFVTKINKISLSISIRADAASHIKTVLKRMPQPRTKTVMERMQRPHIKTVLYKEPKNSYDFPKITKLKSI